MTKTEFETIAFHKGMKFKITNGVDWSDEYELFAVDFEYCTLGFLIDGHIKYFGCQFCELIPEKP
jgi:hypothetical protein